MKITVLFMAKTEDGWIKQALDQYKNRLKHYVSIDVQEILPPKNAGKLPEAKQKELEGELILKKLAPSDRFILLDERGKQFGSEEFAGWINQQQNSGVKNLVFCVGGAFGFSPAIYARADMQFSLSKMTFSHQMIRVFFLEQVYRAYSILANEPYHHR
ncbi:MAG: 23S rRNA (pseudouridine(1915)-N(3))-methyltransferase RlmH [Bacteroidia bacterium]